MASLETRTSTSAPTYRVKWRQDGAWQSETFGPTRKADALRFVRDVEHHGNRWPEGWERGEGYREEPAAPADSAKTEHPLGAYAALLVADMTGLQPDTRTRYARQARQLAAELDALVAADPETDADGASVQNLSHRHVARWINARQAAGAAPKTICNWHGLLFQILQAAADEGLREKNPCLVTGKALPRRDTGRTDEVKVFLTEVEFALLADAMWPGLPDPDQDGQVVAVGTEADRDFLVTAVGTGARWSELTALAVRDLTLSPDAAAVRIQRAWKRNGMGEYARPGSGRTYLGAPKTAKGRRRIRIGAAVTGVLAALVAGRDADALVFTGTRGGPIDQPHFYVYRWQRAVALARRNGLMKSPRFHDLRHTYAAWLISNGVALPEIQQRLGHESIQTTVDVCGGLLEQAGTLANAAMDTALRCGPVRPGHAPEVA